ncbi:MAG: Hsp20/alpha crystallin family protein [Candidatus Thermoplasmatota archaeon]|nr:Hsp20/alpha crystallin family protein [Candidatus Thermoplasmatota archaeon]
MIDIWSDWESLFRNFDKRFKEMLSEAGDNVRTYGYTMYQGPDGVPHVREFGNAVGEYTPLPAGTREPFTDVTREGDKVHVTVELPGVRKKDIDLEVTDSTLSVSVDTESKKFAKSVALPCDVKSDTAKAEYNNGILEVVMESKKSSPKGKKVRID